MAARQTSTFGGDKDLPDGSWLDVLTALYYRGLPQVGIIAFSVIILSLQLWRSYPVPKEYVLHKPESSLIVESLSQMLNVITLGLSVAGHKTHYPAMNSVALGSVCLLQLFRTMSPGKYRQTLRHHYDGILVAMLGLLLAVEALPWAKVARDASMPPLTVRPLAALVASVFLSLVSPHECCVSSNSTLGHAPTPSREETCSWIDYLFTYSRVSGLIHKNNGRVAPDQLDSLPSDYNPELLRQKFSTLRSAQPTTTRTLLLLLWPQLLLCTTLGILLAAAQLVSPMGLHQLLKYIQNPDDAVFQPWLWLVVIAGGRIAQTALRQAYSAHATKLAAHVHAMLTSEVYRSALSSRELHGTFLTPASNAAAASDEASRSTASGILENLISNDIQSITRLQDFLVCVTAVPAAVGAVVALYALVGWPCLVGIALALSGSPFESWIMNYIGAHEEKLKTAQDSRVSQASEYLRSIKIVKYFGWEEPAMKNIAEARAAEQKHLYAIDLWSIGLSLVGDTFPILSLIAIFGLHVGVRNMPLTASTAYTAIQLLEIITHCLTFLALVHVDFARAQISLRRFDGFFKSLTPLDTYPEGPVELDNATFERAAGASFHLRDISIQFRQSGLNVVMGASGSGKSSLLLALLGEAFKKSGSVTRPKDVAYTSQTPWLQSVTIQDNILFYHAFDEKRYRRIVEACCLDVDFAEMPLGDQTRIGQGQFALSGGQRARVALARTLFSDASLLLLDDIFSALDTKTSLGLWNNVFCSNLLHGKTAILVTQLDWVGREGDLTVVVDDGRVQSIVDRAGHVRRAKKFQTNPNSSNESSAKSNASSSIEKPVESASLDGDANEADTTGAASQEEPTASAAGLFSVFSYLLYFGEPLVAALTVATCFLHTGASLYTNYWMSRWVENSAENAANANSTVHYLLAYIGLSYFTEAIDGLRMVAFSCGISVAAGTLHKDLIHAVMASPLSWFTEHAISETLNRLSGDISILDQSIYNSIVPVISNIIQCLLMMGTLASTLPVFTLPAVALLMIGYLITRMYETASHALKEYVSSTRSPVLSNFSQALTGAVVIRAAAVTPGIFYAKMNQLLCETSRAQHAQTNASQWLKFRMSILATAINILAAALALSQRNSMSAGLVGFCLSQATQLSDKVLALIYSFNSLSLDMQTFERVRKYTQLPPEDDCATEDHVDVPSSWPKTGCIELRDVTVSYTPEGQDILKNISLRIEPRERIAIVGRTGSGKSTLVLSLLGFTHLKSGQILYDGVDIQSIPRQRLRQSISTIPQEPQLFQGTIASNIDPSGAFSESDLQNAFSICQSILHSAGNTGSTDQDSTTNAAFAESLSLSTRVDSKGENFSHGQRQIISLCRVLLRRSQLVLLDEATASMDADTDAGVQQALRDELAREGGNTRTLITVAHRLQTIMDYDRVVVMGAGRILEVGSPQELLAEKRFFYDMVRHNGENNAAK